MRRFRVILGLTFLAMVFFALGLGLGLFLPRWITGSSRNIRNTATIIQQIQSLSQLVTVSYTLEKVVDVQDVKWSDTFGTSRVLLLAHGVVKAGVDLSRLESGDVRISGNTISIMLPPAQITDASLDEEQTQVLERSTGLLRGFDKTLESAARQQALDDIKRAARHGNILKEADHRAQEQLANLFHQLGFERVEFRDRGLSIRPPG